MMNMNCEPTTMSPWGQWNYTWYDSTGTASGSTTIDYIWKCWTSSVRSTTTATSTATGADSSSAATWIWHVWNSEQWERLSVAVQEPSPEVLRQRAEQAER